MAASLHVKKHPIIPDRAGSTDLGMGLLQWALPPAARAHAGAWRQALPFAYLAEAGDPAEPHQQKVRPPTAAQASAGQQQNRQRQRPAAHRL